MRLMLIQNYLNTSACGQASQLRENVTYWGDWGRSSGQAKQQNTALTAISSLFRTAMETRKNAEMQVYADPKPPAYNPRAFTPGAAGANGHHTSYGGYVADDDLVIHEDPIDDLVIHDDMPMEMYDEPGPSTVPNTT